MNKRRLVCCGLLVLPALFALLWTFFALSADQQRPITARQNAAALFAQAKKLTLQRDQIGAELNALLADEKRSIFDRIEAAQALGRLQYRPAIPTLIRYIEIRPPESTELLPAPAGEALGRYGDAAIPPLVTAFLAEKNETFPRAGQLEYALLHKLHTKGGTALDTIRTYAVGIMFTASDQKTKHKIGLLLSSMNTLKKDN